MWKKMFYQIIILQVYWEERNKKKEKTQRNIRHFWKDQQARNRVFVQKKTGRKGNMFFYKKIWLFFEEGRVRKRKISKTNWVYCWKKGKTIRNNDETFEGEVFFFKKVEKTKKQEMRKAKKRAQTKIATRRKDKEQEKCAPKRRRKNKTKRTSEKWWKRRWKKKRRERKIQGEDTNRRENQEEKGRKTDEKSDTKKRCVKRKREKSLKMSKNKIEHIFSKREKTFLLHTKRF